MPGRVSHGVAPQGAKAISATCTGRPGQPLGLGAVLGSLDLEIKARKLGT